MDDDEASKFSASKDKNWFKITCQLEICIAIVGSIEIVERIKPC